MCGIAGLVAVGGRSIPTDALSAMNAAMVHRGPDDTGVFSDGAVAIGMRRLSIIGVANGRQPIFNETGAVLLVINGEIYNYQELKDGLERRGHQFATASDAEVLVHLYEERGPAAVEALRGMFAFALYDRNQRRLLLGRDRVGKKPLYYANHDGLLVFASEIKAIHASGLVPKTLETRALDSYLAHGFVVGERTFFEKVRKLPPGCLLDVKGSQLEVRRYWSLPVPTRNVPQFPEAVDRVRTLLDEAVRIRLMSEVPLGVFLSGGIDSSAVVGIMRRHLPSRIDTFVVGFENPKFDELAPARAVARYFGTRHHELIVSNCDSELLLTINRYHDEPAGDPAAIPTYCLARFARERITVALTGEGGDELFGGYRRYAAYRRLLTFERLIPGFGHMARLLHGLERHASAIGPRRLWRAIWIASLAGPDRPRAWLSVFTDTELTRLRADDASGTSGSAERTAEFRRLQHEVREADWIGQSMYIDTKSQLPEQLLMKIDKMTMAASLEARCPFLDQELVDYVAGLHTDTKLSGRHSKMLLREALKGMVPNEVLDRPKHGFEVPIRGWLLGKLSSAVGDLLLAARTPLDGYLAKASVRRLWQMLKERDDQELAKQVWILLNLAIWHDQHWAAATPAPGPVA